MSMIAGTENGAASSGQTGPAPRYTLRNYRTMAKIFHWTTAILVVFMVASGVTMKQLGSGWFADLLFTMHKATGALILCLVVLRIIYRVFRPDPAWRPEQHRRPTVHWLLYGLIIVVPLLGWAGISDYGAREIFGGYSLPAIWPEGAGYSHILFEAHAYIAFTMLVIVALHIGIAMQDHMMRSRTDAGDDD